MHTAIITIILTTAVCPTLVAKAPSASSSPRTFNSSPTTSLSAQAKMSRLSPPPTTSGAGPAPTSTSARSARRPPYYSRNCEF